MRTSDYVAGVAVAVVLAAAPLARQKDAAAVIAEMREALGGAAALDGVKTFTVSGSRTRSTPDGDRRLALEWLAILPDHFLETKRDSLSGPISSEIIYYNGIAGNRPIRKTDSRGLPMPEIKYIDNSPEAIAARERITLMRQARAYSRILLALTGSSSAVYPLQFTYAGTESAEGKSYDVIDATGPDGFRSRLHVDSVTHLPAMWTWLEELPTVVTTVSTVVTTTTTVRVPAGGSPPVLPPPTLPTPSAPPPTSSVRASRGSAPCRWLFKDFKVQDGIKWPRVIEEEFDGKTEEIRLGRVKINPKVEARKFEIK